MGARIPGRESGTRPSPPRQSTGTGSDWLRGPAARKSGKGRSVTAGMLPESEAERTLLTVTRGGPRWLQQGRVPEGHHAHRRADGKGRLDRRGVSDQADGYHDGCEWRSSGCDAEDAGDEQGAPG